MKRIIYVFLLCVLCFVVSCRAFWAEDMPIQDEIVPQSRLTIENVRDRFNRAKPQLFVHTRSENDDNTIMPGTFDVLWDSSIWSTDRGTESVESPIDGQKKFVAQWETGEVVDVRQRLMTFVNPDDSLPSLCVETFIPSPEFFAAHSDDFDQHFVNCDWQTRDYSGIILLHTIDGMLCRIVRVDDGLFVASYSTYDDWVADDTQSVISQVEFMMGGVKVYQLVASTRSGPTIFGGNIKPVVITGESPCWNCGKRNCNCVHGSNHYQHYVNSWQYMYTDVLLLGGGSGGGGGGGSAGGDGNGDVDLGIKEDTIPRDTTVILIKFDKDVDVKQLNNILDLIAFDKCMGKTLLDAISDYGISFGLVDRYADRDSGLGAYSWSSNRISMRRDVFNGEIFKAKVVLFHELVHALQRHRYGENYISDATRDNVELTAYLLTAYFIGKVAYVPPAKKGGVGKFFNLMNAEFGRNGRVPTYEEYCSFYKKYYDVDTNPPDNASQNVFMFIVNKSDCFISK